MSKNHARLHPSRWALVRRRAMKRAKWRCEECRRAGALEAHHIVRLEDDFSLAYELSNVFVCCRRCHLGRHKKRPGRPIPGQAAWAVYVEALAG